MEEFLKQLNRDIKDIFQYNIEASKTFNVPTRNDEGLTFPIGSDKKGKLIETCVLMVDIRNSTKISRQLKKDKVRLGKIYSAFIYAMTDIADENGYVRNIIGDRIMVVFEPQDCFGHAVNCAALMYTVASKILPKYVALDDFKVGFGIEFGEMLILKTGIVKKHEEQSEYKNLVWIGDAANTASKLCDFANKEYNSPLFKIGYEYFDFSRFLKPAEPPTLNPLLAFLPSNIKPVIPEPQYEFKSGIRTSVAELSLEDFVKAVETTSEGWKYDGNKVTFIEKINRYGITSPVLISGKVYEEFKKADPKSSFLNFLHQKDYPNKPFTGTGIYGGSLLLPEIKNIKIQ